MGDVGTLKGKNCEGATKLRSLRSVMLRSGGPWGVLTPLFGNGAGGVTSFRSMRGLPGGQKSNGGFTSLVPEISSGLGLETKEKRS